jgi:spoIIIJ-associated protein
VAHAEASAKSVEAAVTAAAAELGLRADQVEVEVLQAPVPSTFGVIGSPARVRVTSRTASTEAAPGAPPPASSAPLPVRDPSAVASHTPPAEEPEPPGSVAVAAGSTEGDRTGSSGAVGRGVSDQPADAAGAGTPGSVPDRPTGSELGSLRAGVSEPDGTVGTPAHSESAEMTGEGLSTAAAPVRSVGSTGVIETTVVVPPVASPAAGGPSPSTAPETAAAVRPPRRDHRDVPVEPEMVEADTERAGDFLEGLLDALDVDGDITTWVDEVGGHIDLEGSDLDALVGPNGETLDALQELTRLAVLRQSKRRVRLLLDINGFRTRQREQLVAVVKKTVEQVLQTREGQELRPMTPAERKIVHDAVAAIDGAQTESFGEEPNRRVVIRPA